LFQKILLRQSLKNQAKKFKDSFRFYHLKVEGKTLNNPD